MDLTAGGIPVGARVRVTQRSIFGTRTLETSVEGEVRRRGRQKTGSWYAHGEDGKLWVDRLELVRDDGEIVMVNIDRLSQVEVLGEPAA